MPYKGVECQDISKDDEPIKEKLFLCKNFSLRYNCCIPINVTHKKFEHMQINPSDLDDDCIKNNGKSSLTRCCFFNVA